MTVQSKKTSIKFAAFLRGINVGGNKIIAMANLKKAFEAIGFTNVKTFLASGNVVFETDQANAKDLASKIGAHLENIFGFKIEILVRSIDELNKLAQLAPFKNIVVAPQTKLYVTFISDKPQGTLKIPFQSSGKEISILHSEKGVVTSVVNPAGSIGTLDLMALLEKEFGKNITTRNWNTIMKMLGR